MNLGTVRRELREKIVEILQNEEYQVATYLPNYSDEALYQYVKGKATSVACLFVSQPSLKSAPIDTVDSLVNVSYQIRIVMVTPQGVKLAQIPDEKPDTDLMLNFIAHRIASNNPLSLASAGTPRNAWISEFSELFTDDTVDVAQCTIEFAPITVDFTDYTGFTYTIPAELS